MWERIIIFTFAVSVAFIRAAFACDPGYYLTANNECKICGNGNNQPYYCPGDDQRYRCPSLGKTFEEFDQWAFETYGLRLKKLETGWVRINAATGPGDCIAYNTMYNDQAANIYFTLGYDTTNGTYSGTPIIYYRRAAPGYYLKRPMNNANQYFYSVAACTNSHPTNSHYSDHGTNDTYDGTIVDANDCPWECDSGFGKTDLDTCVALCDAGITELHIGTLTFNLYAARHTEHTINIAYNNQVCYTSLATGNANNALNVDINGTTYHTIN